MSHEAPSNIVVTDLSGGDDKAAITWLIGQESMEQEGVLFVAGPGNRSTAVCYNNLLGYVPESVQSLKEPSDPSVYVTYGADTVTGADTPYDIPSKGIEYFIHEDMGHDTETAAPADSSALSDAAYESILEAGTDISVLSLCATTELPVILEKLQSQIVDLVIMGGVISIQGNTAPHQEANFRHDPPATLRTFELAQSSNIPVVLVPLDTTEQEAVLFDEDRLKYLASKLGGRFGMRQIQSVARPDSLYGNFYLNRTYSLHHFPYTDVPYKGVPLHDLTAAIVQADMRGGEGIFAYTDVSVQLNELGQIGRSRPYMPPTFPVLIAGPVMNYDKFWELTAERLAAFL